MDSEVNQYNEVQQITEKKLKLEAQPRNQTISTENTSWLPESLITAIHEPTMNKSNEIST